MDTVPETHSMTIRPTSRTLLTSIRGINSLLPFRPSTTKTKTTVLYRTAAAQEFPVSQRRSRHKATQVSTEANPATHKKATFQWVKGELLGKGSYAKVYLGLNATTGEIMAVKQVELPQTPSDLLNSRHHEIAEALKFERKTLMGLDHPNIVQYLGYEESLEYLSIFLEYVPGGTISSCLQNHGRFSEEVTKSFTRQVLEGLEYLHCMGILHRDLKSDNILVEPSGTCKISDFGISKQAEDILQARAFTGMRGTIYWMAPEMLDSDRQKGYDVKVDIWSVGCVVLEMWTGERPWFGEEIYPVMLKLSQQKLAPPLPNELILPSDALDFRRQCFQIDPHDRPSAADLQAHPYLNLPSQWRFDLTEIEPLRRSFSQVSRRSRRSARSPRYPPSSLSGASEDVPPMPPISAVIDGSSSRPYDGRARPLQAESPHLNPQHYQLSDPRPKQGDGPPVVYITPPNTPQPHSTQLPNNNSRTSLDTSGSVSTTRKGFRIVNPDPEPDVEQEPFVYHPPPLPSIAVGSPYSSRLLPSSVQGASEAYPTNLPGSTRTSLRSPSPIDSGRSSHKEHSRQSSRRQTELASTNGSYYDDDDIWAKRPEDLSDKAGASRRTPSTSRNHRSSTAPSMASTHDEWARPVPEAVYENLQEFFPRYDLEKAIVAVNNPNSATREHGEDRKQRLKTSIRMVAESRAQQLGARRRTKLWDSKVEELRM